MKKNQFVMGILLMLLVFTTTSCDKVRGAWDTLIGNEQQQIVSDTTITVFTAYDVVAQRRAEIEVKQMDSVYYSIPEPILIAIIDDIGANVHRSGVVATYWKNKQYYEGLLTGLKGIKHYMPDSIPNQPPVDINSRVVPRKDSIR